jgi:hypothetical protein
VVRISSCPVDMSSACPSPEGERIEGKGGEPDVVVHHTAIPGTSTR